MKPEHLALVDAVDRGLERALAGQQDRARSRAAAPRVARELRAGHLGHVVVRDRAPRRRRSRSSRAPRSAIASCGSRASLAAQRARDGRRASPRRHRRTRSGYLLAWSARQPASPAAAIGDALDLVERERAARACRGTEPAATSAGTCVTISASFARQRAVRALDRRDRRLDVHHAQLAQVVVLERRRAGEQLEQHRAEAVLIASDRSPGGRAAARARCTPACRARSRGPRRHALARESREPEVDELDVNRLVARDEHVRRRDVGVDDAAIVRGRERRSRAGARSSSDLGGRQRAARRRGPRGSRPRAAPSRSTAGRRRGGRSRTRRRCSGGGRAPRVRASRRNRWRRGRGRAR